MTALERRAASAGKKLANALLAIELYDGDPADVLDEARLALRSVDRHGAREALRALILYYEGGVQ
jgi:hypothetical protein